jgi:hypothetical protein
MCKQLIETTAVEYFADVGKWLLMFWGALAAAHAWPVDPENVPMLSPRVDPEDPYECGAPDLVTLQATAAPAVYREV